MSIVYDYKTIAAGMKGELAPKPKPKLELTEEDHAGESVRGWRLMYQGRPVADMADEEEPF